MSIITFCCFSDSGLNETKKNKIVLQLGTFYSYSFFFKIILDKYLLPILKKKKHISKKNNPNKYFIFGYYDFFKKNSPVVLVQFIFFESVASKYKPQLFFP